MQTVDRTEERLLASLLRHPAAIDEVAATLREDDFRTDAHRRLWSCIVSLHGTRPVEAVSVARELTRRGWLDDAGGHARLADLLALEPTGAKASYYASLVLDESLRRTLGHVGQRLADGAARPIGDAGELLESAERDLWQVAARRHEGTVATITQAVNDAFDRYDQRAAGRGVLPGVLPTGWPSLDTILVGLHPAELVVVAARPSVGKTAWLLSLVRHLALRGEPLFIASIEQARHELADRLLAAEASVDGHFLRLGRLSRDELGALRDAGNRLRDGRVWIDDAPAQSCLRIASQARRLRRQHSIRAVLVDYLQLVEPDSRREPRHEQVGNISRRLKHLARELSLPVVALAQLGRGAEERAEPRLADLRESGSIEADADTVILLHRPEQTNGPTVNIDAIVAKQRNGPIGRATLTYRKSFLRFDDPHHDC